jgi:two-component system, response regulator PdtaR
MVFETISSAVGISGPAIAPYVRGASLMPPRTDTRVAGPGTLVRVTESPRRVVIAEDEALIRLDLKEMLEEDGYEVVGEAGDGESAVRLTTEQLPDLVILDVKMPILDGISAAERIAAERIAPVVILTAFSQRELVERAREAGAMAYLVKPFTKADLVPAIEMAVSRYQEIKGLEAEVSSLEERLETRKAVDRAKGMLQTARGWTEPEAFRFIQKTSMDRRMTMRAVAEAVIAGGLGQATPGDVE